MNCNEIEIQLPAYLEDLLSPEEKKSIAEHLASCPHCSRAFADLKMTEQLVHGLDAVEPPPFFEQRIMARVREEAGRKQSIFRRLFYPLYIKVPIQALATIVIAVLAFQIYQSNGPDMKQIVPLPLPMTELGKVPATAESPASPSAVAPIKRVPAGDLSEKDKQQFAAPPFKSGGKEERMADSRAPMREERPAAVEPAAPIIVERDKEVQPVGAEALSKAQDSAEKQYADQAHETLPPEQKRKEMMADTAAAAGESRKAMAAPSPSRLTAKAAINRSVMDLTVEVGDTAGAIREIEARIGQVNARIIEREHRTGSEFLKVEVSARDVAAFLDLLKTIGRVNLETKPIAAPYGDMTVRIKIVGHP